MKSNEIDGYSKFQRRSCKVVKMAPFVDILCKFLPEILIPSPYSSYLTSKRPHSKLLQKLPIITIYYTAHPNVHKPFSCTVSQRQFFDIPSNFTITHSLLKLRNCAIIYFLHAFLHRLPFPIAKLALLMPMCLFIRHYDTNRRWRKNWQFCNIRKS